MRVMPLLIVLGFSGSALCPPEALAERVLSGHVSAARVEKLTSEIDWQRSLKNAKQKAAEEGKLIVWVHMVGKIDGAT